MTERKEEYISAEFNSLVHVKTLLDDNPHIENIRVNTYTKYVSESLIQYSDVLNFDYFQKVRYWNEPGDLFIPLVDKFYNLQSLKLHLTQTSRDSEFVQKFGDAIGSKQNLFNLELIFKDYSNYPLEFYNYFGGKITECENLKYFKWLSDSDSYGMSFAQNLKNLKNLEKLHLDLQGVANDEDGSNALFKSIETLPKLKDIHLNIYKKNQEDDSITSIDKLRNVRKISLVYGKLSEEQQVIVFRSIGDLIEVQSLELEFSQHDKSLFQHVDSFKVSVFKNLTNLTFLNLTIKSANLELNDFSVLSEILFQLPSLLSLQLSIKQCTIDEEGIACLMKGLQKIETLQKINFLIDCKSYYLNQEFLQSFGEEFGKMKNLKALSLDFNKLLNCSESRIDFFSQGFQNCQNISELQLDLCEEYGVGIKLLTLFAALSKNDNLISLTLNAKRVVNISDIDLLIKFIKVFSYLRYLIFNLKTGPKLKQEFLKLKRLTLLQIQK